MNEQARRIEKPRCFLVYALATKGTSAADTNHTLNVLIGGPSLRLTIFHDHFSG